MLVYVWIRSLMATCMPFLDKVKKRLKSGAGKKKAAPRKSHDASGSDTTAEKSLHPDEEPAQKTAEEGPQQHEEDDEKEKKEGALEEKEVHEAANEGPKQEGEEGATDQQPHEAQREEALGAEPRGEPDAEAASKAEEHQHAEVEASESSQQPYAAEDLPAEEAAKAPSVAVREEQPRHGDGEQEIPEKGKKLSTGGSSLLETKVANLRSRRSSAADSKGYSPLSSTTGFTGADPSSSGASTLLAQGRSSSSSVSSAAEKGQEADFAVTAIDGSSTAAERDTAAGVPLEKQGTGGKLSRRVSSRRDTGVSKTEDERAAVEAAAAAAEAETVEIHTIISSMRRKASRAEMGEGETRAPDQMLEEVTRERDALSKQLEQTAAFYSQHIKRITEIYNSVVQKAEATEQKKNRYAEKLAELVVAGKVDGCVSSPPPAGAKTDTDEPAVDAGPAPAARAPAAPAREPQRVTQLQEELQALRGEKQELEERVAELVDRCAALQQALLEARGDVSTPSQAPAPLQQVRSVKSCHLSHGSSSGSRLYNESGAGRESGENAWGTKKNQPHRQGSSRGDMLPLTRSGSVHAATAAEKSSIMVGGGEGGSAAPARSGDEGRGVEAGDEEEKEEEEELLLQHPQYRLFKGEEAVFQERASRGSVHHQLCGEEKCDVIFPEIADDGVEGKQSPAGKREEKKKESCQDKETQGGETATSDDGDEAERTAGEGTDQTPLSLLSKHLSRKGIEAFLTEEKHDGDNTVFSSLRSNKSMSQQDRVPRGLDDSRLVTPLCCKRRTPKGDLREMKTCRCTVCRHCLKDAVLQSKADIRNLVRIDTGGATWNVECPRCGCKQGM